MKMDYELYKKIYISSHFTAICNLCSAVLLSSIEHSILRDLKTFVTCISET